MSTLGSLLLLAALLAAAIIVFAKVRSNYQAHSRLSRPVAILQIAYFCIYALSSYAFLDSRLSQVNTAGLLGKPNLHAKQVSKRSGELFCTHAGERVRISGRAALYMEGIIKI